MATAPEQHLALADWRRRVAELYATLRADERPPEPDADALRAVDVPRSGESERMPSSQLGRCIKCGREIDPNESLCDVCNRAGMTAPSASQYHGTVAVAIVLAVIGMAVAASLSLRGVGPYDAEVRAVTPADPGYAITYAVTNEGTSPGRAKCQIIALGDSGERLRTRLTLTSRIEGGATAEQTETIPGLADEPAEVTVSCS